MSGATDLIGHRGASLAQRFGVRRATMPRQTTYSNVLALVDGHHAQSRCGDEPSRYGRMRTSACM